LKRHSVTLLGRQGIVLLVMNSGWLAGWCGRDEERVPTVCLLFQQISQNPHARRQHTVKYTKERKKNNAMSAGKCD
jgi:hypothetical protein